MADQPAETTDPQAEAQQRGADPGRVIAKLTQQIGGLMQQAMVAEVIIEDQEAKLTEQARIIDQLRADLVAATSSRPSAGGKPAPAGSQRP